MRVFALEKRFLEIGYGIYLTKDNLTILRKEEEYVIVSKYSDVNDFEITIESQLELKKLLENKREILIE